MPNWTDGDGGCDCPTGHEAGLGYHREGEPGCISGPKLRKKREKTMPCKDDRANETAPAWMLCEAMTIIEGLCSRIDDEVHLKTECSEQLLKWWSNHSTKESARVRKEAAAKLTIQERMALGINGKGEPVTKGKPSW